MTITTRQRTMMKYGLRIEKRGMTFYIHLSQAADSKLEIRKSKIGTQLTSSEFRVSNFDFRVSAFPWRLTPGT
jgi:phospholipid N-methyltransferase